MEEEEEEDTQPPFWAGNGGHRRLRRSYSLLLSSGAVLICVLVIALAFMLVIIPTLQSFTNTILKPHSVKRSWDYLNFVLILFAIICGFLSRNTNETFSDTPHKPNPPTPPPLYHESYRAKSYNKLRSFNSYPDLRQGSPWIAADERSRFYDDTHVNGYRGFDLEEHRHQVAGEEEIVNNIEVVPTKVTSLPASPLQAPAEKISEENKNKRASARKELLLTSLKGKKKKQREESVENVKSIPSEKSLFLHDLIPSKKSKRKKLNSASSPQDSFSKTEPVRVCALEENLVVTDNESALMQIPPPPPPPPPPFNLPAWKFRVQGDFVRIDSISSSSSGSPDLEDEVVGSPRSAEILLFYDPSPDVDTQAATFIQRFRTTLRMKEKQGIGTSQPKARPS